VRRTAKNQSDLVVRTAFAIENLTRKNAFADKCVDISQEDHPIEYGPPQSKGEMKRQKDSDEDLFF